MTAANLSAVGSAISRTASAAGHPSSRAHTSRLFLLLALSAAIPLLIFAGWIAYVTADRQRAESRAAVNLSVARVAEQVSHELWAELQVAEAFANSVSLDATDLSGFYKNAHRLTQARPLWRTVSLVDRDNRQVLNVLRPYGSALPAVAADPSFERAVTRSRPTIGGIGPIGALSKQRLVYLHVPVIREGTLIYVLNVGLVPSGIGGILADAGAPAGWAGVIVDAEGNVVARPGWSETDIGQPAGDAVRRAIARGPEGHYTARTVDGVEVETVYRTLRQPEGWSVHFGVPAEALNAPVLHSLYAFSAGGVVSLVFGTVIVLLAGRDIAHRRQEEEIRSALQLGLSEERGALAVKAAELGTWRYDRETGEFSSSQRTIGLLGLVPREADWKEGLVSLPSALAAVAPSDAAAFREALEACFADHRLIDVELRILEDASRPRWVRVTGQRPPALSGGDRLIYGVIADIDAGKRADAERLELLRALSEAQESEQKRIARELHDQVGQTLTGLSLGLKGLEALVLLPADTPAVLERIGWLRGLTKTISRDIHRAAADLRPTAIDDLGLEKALRAHLQDWTEMTSIPADFQTLGSIRRLPSAIETCAYRVAQESLTNIAKHSKATRASVVLDYGARHLHLVVEDDGVGFDADAVRAGRLLRSADRNMRLGITGMYERLAMVKGSMTIESTASVGTSVFAEIPIDQSGGA